MCNSIPDGWCEILAAGLKKFMLGCCEAGRAVGDASLWLLRMDRGAASPDGGGPTSIMHRQRKKKKVSLLQY